MGAMRGEGGGGGSQASRGGMAEGGGGTKDVGPTLAAERASSALASPVFASSLASFLIALGFASVAPLCPTAPLASPVCCLHTRRLLSIGHIFAALSWRAFSMRANELTARYPADNPVFALSCTTFTLPSTSGHAPTSHS